MSEMKHLSGPWKLYDPETVCLPSDDGRCLRVAFVDSGYAFIPEGIYHSVGAHKYQELADEIRASHAHLIAAAPDLLEALTSIEAANDAIAAKRSHSLYLATEAELRDELIALDEARRKARTAIKKVTGA